MEPHWIYTQQPHRDMRPVSQIPQPPSQTISFGEFLVGATIVGALIWGVGELFGADESSQRTCGICGREGHDRRTCPYDGERLGFSSTIPKSRRCECCGSSRYGTERHHTRGRSSVADFLDVCFDCHLTCCHGGHFQNLGTKPRKCHVTGNRSLWSN